ncbi:LPXTG cell wall anchor domain-containing protein [Arthrobacter sp. zg-Y769]|uniref:LPXTG cell wall anchor domain-containing protein n=1 Tax=Arthrobacter sp. zg-Y769 TaxID=2894191 RepID=UPI001E4129D4|nr:LPXTG cell wall anchor domain-containing protein [Arthrobacter sp. zg-Y769]MCC9206457.1 LPXTG cell wall anchor domain-containing protein [Arthrobacter sp. zg-Y769]
MSITPPCMRTGGTPNAVTPGLSDTGATGTSLALLGAGGLLIAGAAGVYVTRRRGARES